MQVFNFLAVFFAIMSLKPVASAVERLALFEGQASLAGWLQTAKAERTDICAAMLAGTFR
jgi:hypothetical protein